MNSVNNILSNNIIEYPQYANRILHTMASDNSGRIIYKMNEHGYRESKIVLEVPQYNILTLGCSWTMGVGVDNNLIWPTLMGDKLGRIHNYGMYGVSVSFIAKTFYKFLNSIKTPDIALIMWPGFSRRDYINADGVYRKIGGFRKAHSKDPVWKNEEEDLLFLQLRNDNQDLMEFWEAYNFVETMSRLYKIKTYHTVAGYYYDVFKTLEPNLKHTIDYSRFFDPKTCYKNDFKGADKEHPGPEWHKNFTDNFYNFITQ